MPQKYFLLKAPNKTYTPTMYDTGVLQFRHPWMTDKHGYGRLIRLGFAKLNDAQRGEVLGQARTLCSTTPRRLKDIGDTQYNEKLITAYWEGMFHTGYKSEFSQYLESSEKDEQGVEYIRVPKHLFEALEMKSQNIDRLMNENTTLQNTIDSLTKSVGVRSDKEKALTLEQAFTHWKKHLKVDSKSGQIRDNYIRRVGYMVEKLNGETLLHSITKNQIENAVQANSEGEHTARMKAVKRFFADLCKSHVEDGLALSVNPAVNIEVKSGSQIAKEKDDKDILAPFKMLENDKLTAYWKAVIACCSFGGMRLSEALSLTWEQVDFKKKIISIRPTEIKPGLKTDNSKRPVKPFDNLWDILKAHQTEQPVGTKLVFPTADGCWFKLAKGVVVCTGSGALIKALKDAGITEHEPALRMRRWCSTMMELHGFGAQEEIILGHSKKVAHDHYKAWEIIVEKLNLPKLA